MQSDVITNKYNQQTAIKMALLAGNDILIFENQYLYDSNIAKRIVNTIKLLIENKEISKESIEKSHNKIIQLKKWYS